MTIWTYTNNDDGPRWSADGVAVDLLTDGTFRVEGLTDVYETLAQAKDRATRWRGILADAIAGDVKGQAEVLAQTAKMSSSLQYMLDDPLAVVRFPELPPAYPEAEWHGGR